jgi:type IV fimbrial biogenesis protein FimT
MCNNPKQASGFTLLELIVTIAIVGILMALAVPSFNDAIRSSRLTTYANTLVTALNLARSEAVKRGVPVVVRKISTTTASYWSVSGWNVFVDTDGDNVLDTGEEILRTYPALPASFTLMANNFQNYITYTANGASNINGSFAVCDNRDGNNIPEPYTSRLIIINNVGRIRMGKDTNNDGIPEKDDGSALTSCTTP